MSGQVPEEALCAARDAWDATGHGSLEAVLEAAAPALCKAERERAEEHRCDFEAQRQDYDLLLARHLRVETEIDGLERLADGSLGVDPKLALLASVARLRASMQEGNEQAETIRDQAAQEERERIREALIRAMANTPELRKLLDLESHTLHRRAAERFFDNALHEGGSSGE